MSNTTIYVYMWKESKRVALFNYLLSNPPGTIQMMGKCFTVNELFYHLILLSRSFPNSTLSGIYQKPIKMNEVTFDYAYLQYYGKDNNYATQLSLF